MILWLNCEDNKITFNKKNYLLRAAQRLGFPWVRDLKTRKEGEEKEYVLNIEPYSFTTGNKWTGLWEIDLLLDRQEYNESTWGAAHTIFIAINSIPVRLSHFQDKIRLLYQACDPELHRYFPIERKYDFIHCGTRGINIYSERDRLIGILKTVGFSFNDFNKEHPPYAYVDNLNTARVQFIRSMGQNYMTGEAAQRFFECLAIGPVLVNYSRDLDNLGLIDGGDYLVYHNDTELIEKMNLLIKNKEFAREMADKGRNKALLYHTYEHRLMSIINTINEHEGIYNRNNG